MGRISALLTSRGLLDMPSLFTLSEASLESMFGLGIGLLVLLGILLVISFARRRERLRREAFAEVLHKINAREEPEASLEFSEEDSEGRLTRLQEFRVGGMGRRRRVRNVVYGSWAGREVLCCDYRYVVGHGKHQRSYSQSILMMKLGSSFPPFVMAPEGFFAKVAQVFGASDIDFLTHPEFSKNYVLKGKDEGEVRAAFDFDLLEYFEQRGGLTLESHDGLLLFYRANKRCKPELLEMFFEEGFEALDALSGKFPAASA